MAVTTAEKPRSRSKLTKALVATGVGVALLAGGGGTFAKWYDEETVDEGRVMSGVLDLELGEGGWTAADGEPIQLAEYVVSPGDVLTYANTVVVTAQGSDLSAKLTTTVEELQEADPELADALHITYSVNGTQYNAEEGMDITASAESNMESYAVEIVVTFPSSPESGKSYGNGAAGFWHQYAQGKQVDLGALTIHLQQD